ncbi:MAG: hypothetical protein EZS28_036227 [Streblomastix strix]|uniref:IFT52 GIFT domain-containing protein n=1 Tax=Streblomastix strix TaxID=222440 RepID=A0A5J4UBP7_9EUKA|nr:MAG: hypothetical protein EZS28_036227 [Streblomastix strix]
MLIKITKAEFDTVFQHYGVAENPACVISSVYVGQPDPKCAFISDGVLNREIAREANGAKEQGSEKRIITTGKKEQVPILSSVKQNTAMQRPIAASVENIIIINCQKDTTFKLDTLDFEEPDLLVFKQIIFIDTEQCLADISECDIMAFLDDTHIQNMLQMYVSITHLIEYDKIVYSDTTIHIEHIGDKCEYDDNDARNVTVRLFILGKRVRLSSRNEQVEFSNIEKFISSNPKTLNVGANIAGVRLGESSNHVKMENCMENKFAMRFDYIPQIKQFGIEKRFKLKIHLKYDLCDGPSFKQFQAYTIKKQANFFSGATTSIFVLRCGTEIVGYQKEFSDTVILIDTEQCLADVQLAADEYPLTLILKDIFARSQNAISWHLLMILIFEFDWIQTRQDPNDPDQWILWRQHA